MSARKGYQVMADAFVAEGVRRVFALMGDGNMQWVATMADAPGVSVVHARHEHCACAMADGYARVNDCVGVASVTCGPGYTQIMTALVVAARGNVPMVILVGDTATTSPWFVQQIQQGPLAAATGARFVEVRSSDRILDCVREAFYIARSERLPVVLSVPMDLQTKPFDWSVDYTPSTDLLVTAQRPEPDPRLIEKLADMIAAAERPVVVGGRGAMRSGAAAALEQLAERCGALLGTSLLAKGLFDANPFALGIAGAFANDLARELYASADLVIGVGAGLGHFTTEGGYLFPAARVVQIDVEPHGFYQGLRIADLHVRADALAATHAVLDRLRDRKLAPKAHRTPELAKRIAASLARPDPFEFPPAVDLLDPRAAVLELDRVIPKDWQVVVGGGHYFSIALTHLRGRAAERYQVINDFGAIGSALSAAIGIASARSDGKVLLIEGDGSMLMHIQELETAKRHGIKLLMAVMNDGGYGAEVHKLRAQGIDPREAVHGRGDLAALARGFGLRGSTVTAAGQMQALLSDYDGAATAEVWDMRIDDKVTSAGYRRVYFGQA